MLTTKARIAKVGQSASWLIQVCQTQGGLQEVMPSLGRPVFWLQGPGSIPRSVADLSHVKAALLSKLAGEAVAAGACPG